MADGYSAAQRVPHGIEGDGRMVVPGPGPNPVIGGGVTASPD
ncbi:hypothetical protein AB0E10_29895 [Streptomyces sp. NPDC048045]